MLYIKSVYLLYFPNNLNKVFLFKLYFSTNNIRFLESSKNKVKILLIYYSDIVIIFYTPFHQ